MRAQCELGVLQVYENCASTYQGKIEDVYNNVVKRSARGATQHLKQTTHRNPTSDSDFDDELATWHLESICLLVAIQQCQKRNTHSL